MGEPGVSDEPWVVLEEHMLPVGWVLIDGDGAELLFLEAALKQEGIDAAFDPFRPGEAGGFTRDCAQPVRLMVRQSDLDRAREIVDQARRAEPEPPAT